MKFDWMRVPAKKAWSTPALSKPDEPKRARCDDEICALETAIAHRRNLGKSRLREYLLRGLGIVGQELRKCVGKIQVVADDDGQRRCQDFGPVLFRRERGQLRLTLRTSNPDKPRPAAVGRGRPPLQEVVEVAHDALVHGRVVPSV